MAADEYDGVSAIEFGIIFGPTYKFNEVGELALHMTMQYNSGWGGDDPEGIEIVPNMSVGLQAYFDFSKISK